MIPSSGPNALVVLALLLIGLLKIGQRAPWRTTGATACGTAAVITPVGRTKSAAGEWNHGDGEPGPVTMKLREALTGIQAGLRPDTHNWMHKLI